MFLVVVLYIASRLHVTGEWLWPHTSNTVSPRIIQRVGEYCQHTVGVVAAIDVDCLSYDIPVRVPLEKVYKVGLNVAGRREYRRFHLY